MTPAASDAAPLTPRPAPRRGGEWPIAAVLAVVGLGLLLAHAHHFRIGAAVAAGGVLLAAGFRLLLPARTAGLLVVRSRALDVAVLVCLGVPMLVLALAVPPLRP